jgi:hypothetical protein
VHALVPKGCWLTVNRWGISHRPNLTWLLPAVRFPCAGNQTSCTVDWTKYDWKCFEYQTRSFPGVAGISIPQRYVVSSNGRTVTRNTHALFVQSPHCGSTYAFSTNIHVLNHGTFPRSSPAVSMDGYRMCSALVWPPTATLYDEHTPIPRAVVNTADCLVAMQTAVYDCVSQAGGQAFKTAYQLVRKQKAWLFCVVAPQQQAWIRTMSLWTKQIS